jgi:acetate kinase
MRVLTLNAGSSSLKFGLFDVTAGGSALAICLGSADALGSNESRFQARWTGVERMLDEVVPIPDHAYACTRLQALFDTHALPWPNAVAHRIVHGGASLRGHALIDDHVLGQIQAATSMAPLHTPAALAGVRFAQRYFSTLPQIACLDTAFHADMPEVAQTLPIARRWRDVGVRRYGFHGLSCASILYQLGKPPARLVIAHLGHGASVTAVRAGRSIDNSMGFSPGGGVMMATRCGDIDPGVLIYLAREHGQDADRLETLTDHQSGLLGVSGLSGDMRVLRAAARHACRRPPGHAYVRLLRCSPYRGHDQRTAGLGHAGVHGRHRRTRCHLTRGDQRAPGVAGHPDPCRS